MTNRVSMIVAGLTVALAVQVGVSAAATKTSDIATGGAVRGEVRIDLHGTRHGPQTAAFGRGRFTISGAISDRGTFVLRWQGIHPGGDPYVLTLPGAKGTIRVTGDGITDYPRKRHWRITGGTKAYASLRGQGRVRGYYTPTFDLTLTGTVASRPASESSPSSSSIAYISSTRFCCGEVRNRLVVVNADGSRRVVLTGNAGLAPPSWSPNGRSIAFQGRRIGGRSSIHVIDADGTRETELARGGRPVWSPDGQRIAFVSGRDGSPDVYVMNADGSGQRNLTSRRLWALAGAMARDERPVWSPNGRKVAFVSDARSPDGRNAWRLDPCLCSLYVVNADGSGRRLLTHNPVHAMLPTWSPDGNKIRWGRYVVNADGSGLRRVAHQPLDGVWSPDGRKIAFVRAYRQGTPPLANYDVHVMNPDGSGERRLTFSPRYDGDPAWSPDGRWIAFRSMRDGNAEIYVMNADGSRQRNVTRSPANDGWFAWSPARTGT